MQCNKVHWTMQLDLSALKYALWTECRGVRYAPWLLRDSIRTKSYPKSTPVTVIVKWQAKKNVMCRDHDVKSLRVTGCDVIVTLNQFKWTYVTIIDTFKKPYRTRLMHTRWSRVSLLQIKYYIPRLARESSCNSGSGRKVGIKELCLLWFTKQ